ncbi:MAG: hypothetical protein JNJ46_07565 [Myxococcales bacterium]|nr:hypothetical protein [Myxococcales bacterium]
MDYALTPTVYHTAHNDRGPPVVHPTDVRGWRMARRHLPPLRTHTQRPKASEGESVAGAAAAQPWDSSPLRLAMGQVHDSSVSTLYQPLHSDPVGSSGWVLQPRTHGAKYRIAPVRREVLVGLDAFIGFESADAELPAAPAVTACWVRNLAGWGTNGRDHGGMLQVWFAG